MSCCGSLFVNLGGGGGTVNTGVLQIAGGVPLDSTLRFVEDQNGTDTQLKLSTTAIETTATTTYNGSSSNSGFAISGAAAGAYVGFLINSYGSVYGGSRATIYNQSIESDFTNGLTISTVNATITNNGKLTVVGAGGNILSLRDNANVEKAVMDNNGIFTQTANRVGAGGFYGISTRFYFDSPSDGVITLYNNAGSSFTRQNFGGTTTDFPAIVATNTTPTLAAKDATGTNLIPFSAEDFKSANLSAGTLNTARPMQFGDKGTVTTGNDLGLDAQIAVEHNGNVYYIPCSTVLLT